jgi:hypothetical protein
LTEGGAFEIAIGALALSGSLVAWAVAQSRIKAREAERFARLELKVETLWQIKMQGGIAGAVEAKGGVVNSPMLITETGLEIMKPVLADLIAWYKMGKEKLSNSDLELHIAKDWSERLFNEIALQRGIKDCMVLVAMAYSILRPPASQVGTTKQGITDPDIKMKKGTP